MIVVVPPIFCAEKFLFCSKSYSLGKAPATKNRNPFQNLPDPSATPRHGCHAGTIIGLETARATEARTMNVNALKRTAFALFIASIVTALAALIQ